MVRLTLILIFSLFGFSASCQNFKITFDADFLNDGQKKSVLFTNEQGASLHAQNFKSEGFEKDFIIEFDRAGSSQVHLTVFEETLNFYGTSSRTAVTFCNILDETIINFIDDWIAPPYFFTEKESSFEEKVIDIRGIRSLEDIILENRDYTISKNKIRKEEILRLRISRRTGNDALIFLKINGEKLHRQLYLPGKQKKYLRI